MKTKFTKQLLIAFLVFTFGVVKSQEKKNTEINFCHGKERHIYLDSLKSCAEIFANDKEISVVSYLVSFNIANSKEPKKFTILGGVFTQSLMKALEEYKREVNDVEIYDVNAEKGGKPLKLTGGTFMFIW